MSKYLSLCQEIRLLHNQLSGVPHDDRQAQRRLQNLISGLQTEAEDALAADRKWKRAGRDFSLRQLREGLPHRSNQDYNGFPSSLCDHPTCFKQGRQPVAILAHLYREDRDGICKDAQDNGLQVEFLSESCYYPGHTIAVLLTPAQKA